MTDQIFSTLHNAIILLEYNELLSTVDARPKIEGSNRIKVVATIENVHGSSLSEGSLMVLMSKLYPTLPTHHTRMNI